MERPSSSLVAVAASVVFVRMPRYGALCHTKGSTTIALAPASINHSAAWRRRAERISQTNAQAVAALNASQAAREKVNKRASAPSAKTAATNVRQVDRLSTYQPARTISAKARQPPSRFGWSDNP